MFTRSTILGCTVILLAASVAISDDGKAKAYLKFWEPIVGTWDMTGNRDGQPIALKWQLLPGTTGYALVSKVLEGNQREDAVHSYDPKEKCWKYVFITDSGYGVSRCHVDLSKYPRLSSNVSFKVETEITTWEGETASHSATWQFPVVEKNQVVILETNCTKNGEQQPNVKSTFKRVSE